MEVRRNVLLGFVIVVIFFIGLSFAAVGLQQRLQPTVQKIQKSNVNSMISTLKLLAALGDEDVGEHHDKIRQLVREIHLGVAEPGEKPLADDISMNIHKVLTGDAAANAQVVADLRTLMSINQQGMVHRANDANRLAQGGFWILVVLGILGVWAAFFVYRRLRRTIIVPLERLAETMRQARSGKTLMRAYAEDAPYEIREMALALNAMIDDRAMHYEQRFARVSRPEQHIVIALMENVPYPTWILDDNGEIRAANQRGMEVQQGALGRRLKGYLRGIASQHLHDADAEYPPHAFEAVDLRDEDHVLCMLLDASALDVDS